MRLSLREVRGHGVSPRIELAPSHVLPSGPRSHPTTSLKSGYVHYSNLSLPTSATGQNQPSPPGGRRGAFTPENGPAGRHYRRRREPAQRECLRPLCAERLHCQMPGAGYICGPTPGLYRSPALFLPEGQPVQGRRDADAQCRAEVYYHDMLAIAAYLASLEP